MLTKNVEEIHLLVFRQIEVAKINKKVRRIDKPGEHVFMLGVITKYTTIDYKWNMLQKYYGKLRRYDMKIYIMKTK